MPVCINTSAALIPAFKNPETNTKKNKPRNGICIKGITTKDVDTGAVIHMGI